MASRQHSSKKEEAFADIDPVRQRSRPLEIETLMRTESPSRLPQAKAKKLQASSYFAKILPSKNYLEASDDEVKAYPNPLRGKHGEERDKLILQRWNQCYQKLNGIVKIFQ